MNIRDFENEDGDQYGLISLRVLDSVFDDTRRVWRFSVKTNKGSVIRALERSDIRLLEEDEAILPVVASYLWVMGKNAQACLLDGRAFADILPEHLWQKTDG